MRIWIQFALIDYAQIVEADGSLCSTRMRLQVAPRMQMLRRVFPCRWPEMHLAYKRLL
jgi:hypothetical protein